MFGTLPSFKKLAVALSRQSSVGIHKKRIPTTKILFIFLKAVRAKCDSLI